MFGFRKKSSPKSAVDEDYAFFVETCQRNPPLSEVTPFTEEEEQFFKELARQMRAAGLNPRIIRLTREYGTGFTVYAGTSFVGRINFRISPDKYAVIKDGKTRATRVFDSLEEANEYLAAHDGYHMETRPGVGRRHMQYSIRFESNHDLENPSLQECIETIPKWIAYIRFCEKDSF